MDGLRVGCKELFEEHKGEHVCKVREARKSKRRL